MEEISSPKAALSRRTVLKSIGVAGTTAIAGVGSSAAKNDALWHGDVAKRERLNGSHSELVLGYGTPSSVSNEVEDAVHQVVAIEYLDVDVAAAELRRKAGPVLDELADRGYLDEPSIEAFDLDSIHAEGEALDPGAVSGGIAVNSVRRDGDVTTHLSAATASGQYDIGIYHQPEADNTYALVETDDGTLVVHSVGEDDEIGVDSDCSDDYFCSDETCCSCRHKEGVGYYSWEQRETCCLQPDGTYDCSTTNLTCPCEPNGVCC